MDQDGGSSVAVREFDPQTLRLPRPDLLDDDAELPDGPRRRLSIVRVAGLLAVLCAAGATAFLLSRPVQRAAATKIAASRFSPYVDVTLTPTYPFETPSANPVANVTLGFVVAARTGPCTPSWGDYYTLAEAQSGLGLDARIRQVQAEGGDPTVSFGGADNTELANSCASLPALTAAYGSVLDRYHLTSVDFDIEGAALGEAAANERRAAAIAALQRARAGAPLDVWLTLPVAPQGFEADGLGAIRAMLAARVTLTGVNLLAMDFPTGSVPGGGMLRATERALSAAHAQIEGLYRETRLPWTSAGVWNHLGVTVMVGQNDVAGQRFTVGDARGLRAFVAAHHVARVSIWSLNRDRQCGSVFAQVGVHSNTCSGVEQTPLEFTDVLSGLPGTVTAAPLSNAAQQQPAISAPPVDDQATSPYPIWQPTAMYEAGYKVVWHRDVYEAKWFSQGTAPDAPAGVAQTPWLLIGPVLRGERYPRPPKLAAGRYPQWSPTTAYRPGDQVVYRHYPFAAKWDTKGQVPALTLPAGPTSPWKPLWTIPGEPGG
ncbi:MAG TPA: chitinase [Solirubrobacteraceae bacterium]|nr:chitinase [Solirubrobacteraceae bacterium]